MDRIPTRWRSRDSPGYTERARILIRRAFEFSNGRVGHPVAEGQKNNAKVESDLNEEKPRAPYRTFRCGGDPVRWGQDGGGIFVCARNASGE